MLRKDWVIAQGLSLGFHKVGVAAAADYPELRFFREWLDRNYHGRLGYMQDPRRLDVRRVLPEARAVICCALAYDTDQPRSTEVAGDPQRGWVSRYAWGDDYHGIVETKLETLRARLAEAAGPGFQAKLYVDTGPVLERVYAKYAGLGWQAKNTCLIDPEMGSFFFVGLLVTNLDLPPDAPLPDSCGACTLCIDACPTGALVEPYVLDARRCISYLTIELRPSAAGGTGAPSSEETETASAQSAMIPEDLRAGMGTQVFGCDICQDVCPWTAKALVTDLPVFRPRPFATTREAQTADAESLCNPSLRRLASLSEEKFNQLSKRNPIRRARWRGLLRNTIVAMGNSGYGGFRGILEKFAASYDGLLSEHARWALARLDLLAGKTGRHSPSRKKVSR